MTKLLAKIETARLRKTASQVASIGIHAFYKEGITQTASKAPTGNKNHAFANGKAKCEMRITNRRLEFTNWDSATAADSAESPRLLKGFLAMAARHPVKYWGTVRAGVFSRLAI